MSTSGAVKPSCWKEKGSNAKPSNTAACFTKLTQPKIKPHAPDHPLDQEASCLKISDDGQLRRGTGWPPVAPHHRRGAAPRLSLEAPRSQHQAFWWLH